MHVLSRMAFRLDPLAPHNSRKIRIAYALDLFLLYIS